MDTPKKAYVIPHPTAETGWLAVYFTVPSGSKCAKYFPSKRAAQSFARMFNKANCESIPCSNMREFDRL